jgi:tetratricopeptide (TPR) repeat protein
LYDSLAETYYKAKEYEKAKENYQYALKLNPINRNAEKYNSEINQILINTK